MGLLYGRNTGISLEMFELSVTAKAASNLISSGCKVHQLSVAAAILPWIKILLNIESTHSVNESKTIYNITITLTLTKNNLLIKLLE